MKNCVLITSLILTILLVFVPLFPSLAFAQGKWERNYGGAGDDRGYSVKQTSDMGYIVAGSYGVDQIYLVKTNAAGDTLWTKTYGGANYDEGSSVQQTTDGGYIVAGWTASFGNGKQAYLVKTNSSGDTLWTRTYGGTGDDIGESVQQTQDGGYIVAGRTSSFGDGDQVYLIKTNAAGGTLWTKTYGGTGDDYGSSVRRTQDGGYIVAGIYDYFGTDPQVYLIKTNATGDTLWTRIYGGTYSDGSYAVQQTQDMGYIVAGYTDYLGTGYRVYLVKTSATGDTLWTRTYGGTGSDWGYSVQQTQDGGYIVAGIYDNFGTDPQGYLIKTNSSGDTLWTRTYGGAGFEEGRSVQQTSDGGFIVAGLTGSYGNGTQVNLIKTDGNGSSGVETAEVRGQRLEVRVTAKPNPFTSFATLPGHEAERFSLFDITGRKVGTYRGDRVGEGLGPGVYFLQPENGAAKPLRIVKVRLESVKGSLQNAKPAF